VIGSFAVTGKQVRFNARIVDVATGEVLNAATLGGAENDVINLPVQLADAVIESLSKKVVVAQGKPQVEEAGPVKVTDAERKKLSERLTENAEAYRAYGRGAYFLVRKQWKEAETEFQKAIELDGDFGSAWFLLGSAYAGQGNPSKALECFSKAQSLMRAKGDEKGVAMVLTDTGRLATVLGLYDEAMRNFEQSLALTKKLRYEPSAITLDNIGEVYRLQDRHDEAMKYYRQSLAISRRLGDERNAAAALYSMGLVYGKQGRYSEAMNSLEQVLAIGRKLDDKLTIAHALTSMGSVHFFKSRYGDALKCYEESLATTRQIGDERLTAGTLALMATVYAQTKEVARALATAREAAELAHKLRLVDVANYDQLVAEIEKAAAR
jgi:tetratricopeptide (TPR) repeat protein